MPVMPKLSNSEHRGHMTHKTVFTVWPFAEKKNVDSQSNLLYSTVV